MSTQFSISKISNGWLVAVPPTQSAIEYAGRMQQQAQGTITYCADFQALCTCLASLTGDKSS